MTRKQVMMKLSEFKINTLGESEESIAINNIIFASGMSFNLSSETYLEINFKGSIINLMRYENIESIL